MAIRETKDPMVVEMPQGPTMGVDPMVAEKEMEFNDAFDGMMAAAAPQGNFGEAAVNRLGESLNRVLELFGPDAKDIMPVEGEQTRLSAQITAALAMIAQAAREAGLDRFVVDLDAITDDRSLEMAAGKLDALAENENFNTFLRSAPREVEVEVDTGELAEMGAPVQTEEEVDVDDLFASRM
jgi:hypothetical protein